MFEILEIIFAIYFFICLLLEFGGIVDIYRSVTLQHILLLITMIILIQYFGKSSWNRNNKAENAVRIGCVIYFLFEIAVILTYVFSRNTSNRLYSIIFVVGVTIQSIFMMRALMFYFSETMQNSIQAETYRSLAYIDVLTGLSNRNAYSKRIEEIEKTAEPSGSAGIADGSVNASSAEGAADHESAANAQDIKNLTSKKLTGPVTLIVLDINNLKQTNDTYGHQAGDRLIRSVADCLMNVFDPVGTVYRIGGDEFLVWLDSDDDAATAQKLSILRNSIESLSLEAGHPQVAMGFASCGADEKFSPDELFRLADDRMYENKKKTKAGPRKM